MKKLNVIAFLMLLLSITAGVIGYSMVAAGGDGGQREEKTYEDYLRWARLYKEQGNRTKAIVSYQDALGLQPESDEAMRELAQVYKEMNYSEEAIEYWEILEQKGTAEDIDVLDHIHMLLEQERLEEAKVLIENNKDRQDEEFRSLYEQSRTDAPKFNLESGVLHEYSLLHSVDIPAGYTLYFTADGSEPNQNSEIFPDELLITFPENTIKARAYSPLGYVTDIAELSLQVDVPVEEFKSRDWESMIYQLRWQMEGKEWDDPVYNYELAQIRELYLIGTDVRTGTNRSSSDYVFYENGFRYRWDDETDINKNMGSIDMSPIKYMPFLKKLAICNQKKVDLSILHGKEYLEELSLLNDGIEDIRELSELKNLKMLALGWNQISDVTPLAGLSGLTSLGLWNNRISDVSSLAGLTELYYFDIAGNQVQDISIVSGMRNLGELWINGNPISDNSQVDANESIYVIR